MKRSLGLLWASALALTTVGIIALSVGCAEDDKDTSTGGSGGTGEGGTGNGGTGNGGTGEGGSGNNGSGCYTGQTKTVAEVTDTALDTAVEISGIATTKRVVASFSKNTLSCLWAVFVKDPDTNRGLMVISYGDKAPSDATTELDCPETGSAIPADIQPGDVLKIVGKVTEYAPNTADCNGVPKQRQVSTCKVEKTDHQDPPAPIEVTDLKLLAAGNANYQGLLVKVSGAGMTYGTNGNPVQAYGAMKIDAGDGVILEVHNKFFYRRDGSQQFDNNTPFTSITGVSHLDYCTWVIQARDKCTDFNPASKDCP